MTPAQAARLTKHGRRLLRRGLLQPLDFVALDCLLWSCRKPGASVLSVTYRALAGLCSMSRGRAIEAVRRLMDLGIIAKTKTRRFALFGRGNRRSIQGPNLYEFTGFAEGATDNVRENQGGKPRARFAPFASKQAALEAVLADMAAARGFTIGLTPG